MPYVYENTTHPIRGNGTAVVALITGLIGLIMTVATGWIPIVGFFLMLLPSLLAIIFGFVGRAQARAGAPHAAKAAAGLTCGFVALLLTVLMQCCWLLVIGGVVMSAAEIAEQSGDFAELREVGQEIEQRVHAEWTRMKADFPEREIEIVDQDEIVIDPSRQNKAPEACCQEPQQDHSQGLRNENEGKIPASGILEEQGSDQIII